MAGAATYQALVKHLASSQYAFICPSPETQARVVHKRSSNTSTQDAKNAEDFFGWNLPCSKQTLLSIVPESIFSALLNTSVIVPVEGRHQNFGSRIRISNFYLPCTRTNGTNQTIDPSLYYIHSSFPASPDSVFFGPDTYLFLDFLRSRQHHLPQAPKSIIDVCCGSGAGAIHLARTYPQASVGGLDLNPRALELGDVNAQLANTQVSFRESNLYAAVNDATKEAGVDLIVSNPPYIASSADGKDLPIYADGGAEFGLDISLRIVEEGVKILSACGVIVVYTGVAIPTARPGHDPFLEKLGHSSDVSIVEYTILHPDMWPEEIGKGAYAEVGRIQVVGAVLRKESS